MTPEKGSTVTLQELIVDHLMKLGPEDLQRKIVDDLGNDLTNVRLGADNDVIMDFDNGFDTP
jgi:hypothetical protein